MLWIMFIFSLASADRSAISETVLDTSLEIEATRSAPCFFQYQNGDNQNIPPAKVRKLMKGKSPGSVMIGGDPGWGNIPAYSWFWDSMRAANEVKARKHVYLMGPGGPTGSSGVEDELWKIMVRAAKDQGIDLNSKAGLKAWNSQGWKRHLFKQLKYFYGDNPHRMKFDSFEVDNLYRAGLQGKPLVDFYIELQKWLEANKVKMTLLPKNLSLSEWRQVNLAIKEGRLKRSFFSDFAIQEIDAGNRSVAEKQKQAAQEIGITVLDSFNTYDYHAKGGSCPPR